VPIVTGSSIRAGRLAQALFDRGVNVQPILYPAVPERAARLRFFVTASHTEEQIRNTVDILLEESRRVASEPSDLAAVAQHLGKRSLLSR
jgi:8-amino-7-oxononanoate synthase